MVQTDLSKEYRKEQAHDISDSLLVGNFSKLILAPERVTKILDMIDKVTAKLQAGVTNLVCFDGHGIAKLPDLLQRCRADILSMSESILPFEPLEVIRTALDMA